MFSDRVRPAINLKRASLATLPSSQKVSARPRWQQAMTPRDDAALTPLIWSHVNPYGRFDLDMNARITRTSRCLVVRGPHLIGTPESLLFEGDEERTVAFQRIAAICEPPPGQESAVVANALVTALPKIAGKTNLAEHQQMVEHTYRVSRALLGDDLADQLQFPKLSTSGLLRYMRFQRDAVSLSHRIAPTIANKWRGKNFVFLLEASMLDDLSYRLPDKLKATEATPW